MSAPPEIPTFEILFWLHGALPEEAYARLRQKLAAAERHLQKQQLAAEAYADALQQLRLGFFQEVKAALLEAEYAAPASLHLLAIRQLLVESLHYYNGRAWELLSFEIRPHFLLAQLRPLAPLAPADQEPEHPFRKALHSLKGRTAKWANLHLGRTGQPFWHRHTVIAALPKG